MKHYSKLNLFLRSALFSIYSILSMVIYSFVCVATLILPLKTRYIFIRAYLSSYWHILKLLCHIRYELHGTENIPKDHACIILSKHQSTWETFFLPTIFPDPAIILKRELLWIPFFGWGLKASDPIAIDRTDRKSAMQQIIQKGQQYLNQGRSILMFPEGTRTAFGTVGHYRLGGARLAAATKTVIIPVAHNAGAYWPRRRFIKLPGTVHVVIGPAIEPADRTPEELLALTKDWIETTMVRIQGFVDKPTCE